MALLEVRNLSVAIKTGRAALPVVNDISFTVDDGEALGVVGESGCGKSLTSLAIMGLLEGTPVRITAGEVLFGGKNLLAMAANERRAIMGNEMAMIFQEPMTSLNPVYRIGDQIMETIRQHQSISKSAARAKAIELLSMVRIPDPKGRIDSFPHQLSGGMRQRVMIAMALAGSPKLLIADEPTTALDVTVQAQILDLLIDLQKQTGMAVILISHDLGVIAETCHKVAVMYRGKVIEAAPAETLFSEMSHPYTRGLMNSIPVAEEEVDHLEAIPGRVPAIDEDLPGCAFHPRCSRASEKCIQSMPEETHKSPDHTVRCYFPLETIREVRN